MGNAFYTVQPSDVYEGLLGIARRYYRDPDRWQLIYAANRAVIGDSPHVVRPGQQLVLPDLVPDDQAAPDPQLYRVGVRDAVAGLKGVAERLWGMPERWRELYAVNRGVIGDDPSRLLPGQWLVLP